MEEIDIWDIHLGIKDIDILSGLKLIIMLVRDMVQLLNANYMTMRLILLKQKTDVQINHIYR